jgi:hypothetical protein
MKFSLKEAFDLLDRADESQASETRHLLEAYGRVEVKHPAVEADGTGDELAEAEEDEVSESVGEYEEAEEEVSSAPQIESSNPRRDDLTLERWRSMAGLV